MLLDSRFCPEKNTSTCALVTHTDSDGFGSVRWPPIPRIANSLGPFEALTTPTAAAAPYKLVLTIIRF